MMDPVATWDLSEAEGFELDTFICGECDRGWYVTTDAEGGPRYCPFCGLRPREREQTVRGFSILAIFKTNTVLNDEANTTAYLTFDSEYITSNPDLSMKEAVRPYLEDKYGMIEDLDCHTATNIDLGAYDE